VTFEPEQFFARNDQVVVFVLARARPTGSTALMETRIGHLWAMQNGKAARCEAFLEPAAALQAAGLSEQDAHVDS
jgi:ketosteroid isomerase-like protein